MINDLFDIFPESIAFKILTYQPHKTTDMIKEYWKRLHKIGMSRILSDIYRIENQMRNDEPMLDFYYYYMYIESPRESENQDALLERDVGVEWFRN